MALINYWLKSEDKKEGAAILTAPSA